LEHSGAGLKHISQGVTRTSESFFCPAFVTIATSPHALKNAKEKRSIKIRTASWFQTAVTALAAKYALINARIMPSR